MRTPTYPQGVKDAVKAQDAYGMFFLDIYPQKGNAARIMLTGPMTRTDEKDLLAVIKKIEIRAKRRSKAKKT